MDERDQILLFIRAFYGQPSIYLWEDDVGEVHIIPQLLVGARGPVNAVASVWANTLLEEMVRGSLLSMTICTLCADLKEWGAVHDLLRRYFVATCEHIPRCKEDGTAVVRARWLASQCSVQQLQCLQPPSVWRGELEFPTHQQGAQGARGASRSSRFRLEDFGGEDRRAPCFVGTDSLGSRHNRLGSFCRSARAARANFYLRAVSPDLTNQFAETLKNLSHLRSMIVTSFVKGRCGPSQCVNHVSGGRRKLAPRLSSAVHLTPLDTPVQFAQQQGCWDAEVGRWSPETPKLLKGHQRRTAAEQMVRETSTQVISPA